jgi:hypothetical protein
MSHETLNISLLEKAITRLQEGLERYHEDLTDSQIRDGLIQRFEFTYELVHKTLKRYLEYTASTPEAFDAMPFPDLIRSGNEQGLLKGDWAEWKQYRKMRGATSHTYNEEIALEVATIIPQFLQEAIFLRDVLRQRLA